MSDFEYNDAKLGSLSLLLSLVGASFSGKTMSSLRLATGIQRISGGEIALIDTENGRALHYANDFTFKHVPFRAPFSPERYLEALEYCQGKGAKIIIVDSGSHCWESEGGVLEQHETELDRIAGKDWKKRERATFAAWIGPKKAYTRLVNTMLQMNVHMIWCMRAKKKLAFKKGEQPTELGFVSIAGTEMMYEFQLSALLYPGSNGVPTWDSTLGGERMMAKLPRQFESIFRESQPLSEDIGRQLAEWAAGGTPTKESSGTEKPKPDATSDEECAFIVERIMGAASVEAIERVANENRGKAWSDLQRRQIKTAIDQRKAEL